MARLVIARTAGPWLHDTIDPGILMDGSGRGASAPLRDETPPGGEPPDPAEIFQKHATYIGRLALRLLGRTDEIEDIVQDVFLEALPRLPELRDPVALRGWLAVITTRLVARRLRRRRVRRWLGLSPMPANAPEILVDANAEERVLLSELYAVLDRVPAQQRIAWVLRNVEDLKLEEVAAACGCSVSAVKRRVAAVQERLDKAVGRE